MNTLIFKIAVGIGVAVCACFALSHFLLAHPGTIQTPGTRVDDPTEEDSRLQTAATNALGQREGTIVIVDPQTGRVRAVVNQQLAFQNAFPPGSTIKPFTALALLREGKVTQDTRMRCRHKYKRVDVVDTCSHPANLPPVNPSEAIAYSCNYYFATFGERLDEDGFSRMLADFGFGQTTG